MESRSGACINIVIYHVNDYRHSPTLIPGPIRRRVKKQQEDDGVFGDGFTLDKRYPDPKPFFGFFFIFIYLTSRIFFALNVT